MLKVCWDSDVHLSHFSGQTATRNQVETPELPNRKKRKFTEHEDHAIEGVVIEMNQHVLQTNGDTKSSKKSQN